MKIITVRTISSKNFDIIVEDADVINLAHVLENSKNVEFFYISNINVKDQQMLYGVDGFEKWKSSI